MIKIHGTADGEILSDDIQKIGEDEYFVCASPIMRKLRAQAQLLSQTDVPLLIQGEAGTGKSTIARLIHSVSVRSGFKFMQINCGALPGDLLEGELFGTEHVTRNGAIKAKPGVFELCEKGTVVLKDITELPPVIQAELVYVLQNKRFFRPGSQTAVNVDVRILASTSGNAEQALSEKRLREDLYYHLSAFTMQMPPLRQRKEEVALLLHHCMHRLAKHYGLASRAFSQATLDACQAHEWPGNLNELEDFVKRCLVLGDPSPAGDAPKPGSNGEAAFMKPGNEETEASVNDLTSLRSLVQSVKGETERNAIVGALEKTGWNRKAAARLLKVSYRTMLYKIEQYHMTSPEHSGTLSLRNGTNGGGSDFKGQPPAK